MSVLHNVVRGAQDGASPLPCKVAILPREVSFAARNYQNGLLAPLARDRGAPHRTQLVHPVTRAALRARIGQTIGSVGWLPPRHDGASPAMALGAALAGCPVGCPPSFPSCKSPPSNYPVTVTWVELHTLQHGEVWPNQGIDEKGTVMGVRKFVLLVADSGYRFSTEVVSHRRLHVAAHSPLPPARVRSCAIALVRRYTRTHSAHTSDEAHDLAPHLAPAGNRRGGCW